MPILGRQIFTTFRDFFLSRLLRDLDVLNAYLVGYV